MTPQEFAQKWGEVDRNQTSFEEELELVEDAFNMYEETGFSDTFHTPYEEMAKYNGKPFKVVGRVSYVNDDVDLECLPQWKIVFDEDDYIEAFPEEICKIELNV